MNSTTPIYSEYDNYQLETTQIDSEVEAEVINKVYVIIILGIVVILGLIGNIANIVIILKSKILHNAFGYLCASHSFAEILNLLIAGLWTIIVAVFDDDAISSSIVTYKLGQIAMGVCLLTSYTVLAKAINRLIAITKPMVYRNIFSNNNAKLIILIVWILGAFHSVIGFFDGCNFILDPVGYYWYFDVTSCGQFLAFYIDLIYSCLIMFIVVIFDSYTLISLFTFYKHVKESTSKSKNRLDIRFFIQSCLTTLLQVLMLVSFHLLSRVFTLPWGVFLTTTFAWSLCSALDGIVNVGFNFQHVKLKISKLGSTAAMSRAAKTDFTSKVFVSTTNI